MLTAGSRLVRGRRRRKDIARVFLALLLFAMAAGQLADLPGFVEVVGDYDLGTGLLTWVVALGLFVGEATGGVLLLRGSPSAMASGAAVTLVVAIGWSVLALTAFGQGKTIDNCGCFGVDLAQPLRWWILLEDVDFISLAAWVLFGTSQRARADAERGFDAPASRA